LKGTEIAIKKIRTSFEKQIERTNKKFELKGKIKKKIKLTNESETNKKKKECQFPMNSMMINEIFKK
jgi:hypothetical protein